MDSSNNIVLTGTFFPEFGGAHSWLYELFSRSELNVKFVAKAYRINSRQIEKQNCFDRLHKNGSLSISRVDFGFKHWGLGSFGQIRAYYKMLKSIWTRLEKGQRNIIYCLKAVPEAACLLPLKLIYGSKFKIILFAHGEEYLVGLSSSELWILTKIALWISDEVIANSMSTKKIIEEHFSHPRIKVITPGINYQDYQFDQQTIEKKRKFWGTLNNDIVVFSVSRLEKRKNHLVVLKVISKLIQDGCPVKYVIGGTGEEESQLKQMAKNLHIEKYVIFEGAMNEADKRLAFASCDIHVMASIQKGPMIEGFGIVFLEAAAAGIPSVSGNNGGQPEAVIHGETGYVADGNKPTELYKYMYKLIQNRQLRTAMGLKARKWAQTNAWECKIKTFYESVK